jgi:uncharacterized protein (TIGR03790 family)
MVSIGALMSLTVLASAADDLAARTVILVNSVQPDSVELGEFYARQRGIPAANLVALPMPEAESITWREFVDQVWQPLQDELLRRDWLEGISGMSHDRLGRKKVSVAGHRIAYLVVCRGTPLRIYDDPTLRDEAAMQKAPEQFRTNQGAVDSELSLLAAGGYEIDAFVPNPLFDREHPLDARAGLVVKVARLDGPTAADAHRLVTSAVEGERHGLLGRYYIDLRGPHPDGDRWFEAVRQRLDKLGFDGDVDRAPGTLEATARCDAPVLYFGWYAANLNGPFAHAGFEFSPGAVALHIHSFSAETLRLPTKGWCGPLVARGVAATVGNVFEPYLQLTHRPDLLLQALARGATLGDAAYFALPALSWQAILIGDPLYRPFRVTLGRQQKNLGSLPPALAPYAIIRVANLLALGGKTGEARAVLQTGMRKHPEGKLPLSLALARMALRQNDEPGMVAALRFLATAAPYRSDEWTLVRLAAELLVAHGAPDTAIEVYAKLAAVRAPTPEAGRALLMEARLAAETAGNPARAEEFNRLLNEERPATK